MQSKPKIWRIDPENVSTEAISEAVSILERGGLVIYPTETFYALGAVATIAGAVEKVFAAKKRNVGMALPVICSDKKAVLACTGRWPKEAEILAGAFWPGPLTLLLPASPLLPPVLHTGTGKVAVRISPHPAASLLARLSGGTLVSTSANLSGDPAPAGPREISEAIINGVDGFIDAGDLPGGLPSTIVDVTLTPPRLVRSGALPWEAISRALSDQNS